MTIHCWPLILAPLVAFAADPAPASQTASVSWEPASPTQGSLVVVSVRFDRLGSSEEAGEPPRVLGTLAGQPLHFESIRSGGFRAIGGIPIHSQESLPLTLIIEQPSEPLEHRFLRIPVTPGSFVTEQLTVDPRFSIPPDSALEARIARERAAAKAVSRRSHDTPRMWHEPFTPPAPGSITSEFGRRREFNGEVRGRHMGVDFSGAHGTPVAAANDGIVALTADLYYGGRAIYLDHGRGLVTAYLHLSAIEVAPGDTVARGQTIGRIGATGRVTASHLHWIGRYGTVSINGLDLLELDLAAFGEPEQTIAR